MQNIVDWIPTGVVLREGAIYQYPSGKKLSNFNSMQEDNEISPIGDQWLDLSGHHRDELTLLYNWKKNKLQLYPRSGHISRCGYFYIFFESERCFIYNLLSEQLIAQVPIYISIPTTNKSIYILNYWGKQLRIISKKTLQTVKEYDGITCIVAVTNRYIVCEKVRYLGIWAIIDTSDFSKSPVLVKPPVTRTRDHCLLSSNTIAFTIGGFAIFPPGSVASNTWYGELQLDTGEWKTMKLIAQGFIHFLNDHTLTNDKQVITYPYNNQPVHSNDLEYLEDHQIILQSRITYQIEFIPAWLAFILPDLIPDIVDYL